MLTKKIKNRFTAIFLVLFLLSGCTSKSVSSGKPYHNKRLNVEIVPPAGWAFRDMSTSILEGLAIYPTDSKNVRLYVIAKSEKKPLQTHINEYREKRRKLAGSKIHIDRKGMLNLVPAHIIKTSYISDDGFPAQDQAYLITRNNKFYLIGYWIFKDKDYRKNITSIKRSLKTFKFKK